MRFIGALLTLLAAMPMVAFSAPVEANTAEARDIEGGTIDC
jgi:hypothetical protein